MKDRALVEELGDNKKSLYQQYLQMFVGRESFISFFLYELLTSTLGPLPGALGYFLRGKCYRYLLQSVGRGTAIGAGVILRCPNHISIGNKVMIDNLVVLDAKGPSSQLILGNQILLGRNTILSCSNSSIKMGDFISVGPFCFFASRSHLSIGSNVAIGGGTHILAGGHEFEDPDVPVIKQERISKGITVEDNVWIGTGAKILDGVKVGQNSIIGAGSVVVKDVPPWSMVLGNPARIIQNRKK